MCGHGQWCFTGESQVSAWKIDVLPVQPDGTVAEMDIEEFLKDIKTEPVAKSEDKRFEDISEEHLDTLAIERNSYRTRKQTVWGAKIFEGETPLSTIPN